MKPLIILTGPTASGKTDLSVKLAKAIDGEIISADSIQVYKYMDIGSAKVTEEEMCGVKHYLVDELLPDEEFNVYEFKKRAEKYIDKIYEKGKIPIIAGGTGFYIQAILYDIDFSDEDNDMSYRKELEALADEKGNKYVHNMLREIDSQSADDIHFNNRKRVIRALEYYRMTGRKMSEHNSEQHQKVSPYDFKYFVLNMDRDELYERIEKRVDIMLEAGLEDEVRKLLEMGYTKDMVSMQGIGYKEMAAYIAGEISYDEAVTALKKNTRHFAKRQMTWFRREKEVTMIDFQRFENDRDKILQYLIEESNKVLL